jgi:nicotinamide riboside transporter PnuC
MTQYYPPWVQLVVWAINVSIIIILTLIRGTARWTALGAGIVGIIMVIWAVIEIVILPPAVAFGPAVNVVFGALFAFFTLRAYFEKPPP